MGASVGAAGTVAGEVVFNTAMAGYQEVLTDPSYRGQIVAMTYPLMGNYGVFADEIESAGLHLSGFVVREMFDGGPRESAGGRLGDYLTDAGIVGLAGIDTRALTRRLRDAGALRGVISTDVSDPAALVRRAQASVAMSGQSLIGEVACAEAQSMPANGEDAAFRMVVIDCGAKSNILRMLEARGCDVVLVPPTTPAQDILAQRPGGVLVTNGPGDPAAESGLQDLLRKLVGRVPLFGICMGCQLLGIALGARTYKLRFGHHGVNHPVLHLPSRRVEITSQNHGFAVDEESLIAAGAVVTHRNLFDGSVEGFAHDGHGIAAVQFHPEAAPGPHDSMHVFDDFLARIEATD